ncbi:transposase [Myroides phaeus]|uniref:REP element-mobilizing transposase RayT n=1 Tax=Myroides phaeus TaxID=702745 RepID=A0A1G8EDV3_9FLAO|nr:transposase [Myroides phaeus]MEC4115954.1 transposase [Myroides phaeus]SDH67950.1 REP element-mobilizing transposase RayT [Myroides phaeus]
MHRPSRRSIRLKGYDYSQEGLYFITICCKDNKSRFGYIFNDEMILNEAGKMVEERYKALESKFPNIRCDEMVVMPNHFHCIIEIINSDKEEWRVNVSICKIVQWFKTMTTNEYIKGVRNLGWKRFDKQLWQRNYYEHVIRTYQSYCIISNYILCNPERWLKDKYNNEYYDY